MSNSWMRGKFIILIKMIQDKFCYLCDYIGLLALNKWGDGWSESHCSYDRKMHDDSEKCASKHECYKEQGSRSWMGESKWTRISIIVQNVDSKTKKIFISFEIFMLTATSSFSSTCTAHFFKKIVGYCVDIWWQQPNWGLS